MIFTNLVFARESAARLNATFHYRGSRSRAVVQTVAEGFAVIIIRR